MVFVAWFPSHDRLFIIIDVVANAAHRKFLTIDEIAEKSGLTESQVRGYVHAPKYRDEFERRPAKRKGQELHHAAMEYRYTGD